MTNYLDEILKDISPLYTQTKQCHCGKWYLQGYYMEHLKEYHKKD